VIGFSAGTTAALQMALRHPDRVTTRRRPDSSTRCSTAFGRWRRGSPAASSTRRFRTHR
jgi:hypothetical protein